MNNTIAKKLAKKLMARLPSDSGLSIELERVANDTLVSFKVGGLGAVPVLWASVSSEKAMVAKFEELALKQEISLTDMS